MRARTTELCIKITLASILYFIASCVWASPIDLCGAPADALPTRSFKPVDVAQELGWIDADTNRCGGYYFEPAISYPKKLAENNLLQLTSDQVVYSEHGTSISEGKVTLTRAGQQLVANKACLYRDPVTGKLSAVDLFGDVILREPNDLVLARRAHYDIKSSGKSLYDILYRTAIYSTIAPRPLPPTQNELEKPRVVTQLSAWGKATSFSQTEPKIYEFRGASYSTCPPTKSQWTLYASHIVLNKETGRGYATHGRLAIKNVPVLYIPYFNFPIDSRRQTGFLFPTMGTSSLSGSYFGVPFYWNMAPNYDSTITPTYMKLRGVQLVDNFRYLTLSGAGHFRIGILPNDKEFSILQETYQNIYGPSTDTFTQANLRRLENASTTRKGFSWQDNHRFNEHWFSNIDYNWVSDDYYLNDFGNGLNEVTQNQLLQQADITYKGINWNFLGRVQAYQTLHPLNQPLFQNQYSRYPQLHLQGDYPNQALGLEYFIDNDITRFQIRETPGSETIMPVGQRYNVQPGISRPYTQPYLFVNPRLQFAFTQYDIGHVGNLPHVPKRALPIFDVSSGLFFDRDFTLSNQSYKQTLEPQIYYTYIPYRNQNNLPVFDTSLNILTYDQLFTYNRYSSIDRIGDANQISLGVTTRFIENNTGAAKAKLGLGEILYFQDRRVTLCNDNTCADNPNNPNNYRKRSPLSGFINYQLNPNWMFTSNTIWSTKAWTQIDNQSLALQYKPDTTHIINLGYNFVRNNIESAQPPLTPIPNLSQTDFSFLWPLSSSWSAVGRWTQDWNQAHFQNLLYGLQYDSCCWAVRFVAGKSFVNLNSNNTPQYNPHFFIQFALKGLGAYGPAGDPSSLLSNSISGYHDNFGQDY